MTCHNGEELRQRFPNDVHAKKKAAPEGTAKVEGKRHTTSGSSIRRFSEIGLTRSNSSLGKHEKTLTFLDTTAVPQT